MVPSDLGCGSTELLHLECDSGPLRRHTEQPLTAAGSILGDSLLQEN